VVATFKGRDLKGWTYEPLFTYCAGQAHAFQVLTDDFVSTGDGTGIVHIAPAYGEDDFRWARRRVCRRSTCWTKTPLHRAGSRLRRPVLQGCGQGDHPPLKDEGKLVHQSTLVHSYPFCERTDTPLIYRAIEAWYVKVEDIRDRLVANNATVHWMPEAIGEKRFGNWLREAKDWNISRNRFWGSCIPVWVARTGIPSAWAPSRNWRRSPGSR
jgi:isoleucyl-tRNA synthetase